MKNRAKNSKKSLHPGSLEPGSPEKPPGNRKLSPCKLWLFRLTGVFLLPFLVLGLAEIGLRLAGYGYSTAFFKPVRIGQSDYLVENDKFGLRFFPPALARSP